MASGTDGLSRELILVGYYVLKIGFDTETVRSWLALW